MRCVSLVPKVPSFILVGFAARLEEGRPEVCDLGIIGDSCGGITRQLEVEGGMRT